MTASNTPLRIGILGAAKIARAFIAGVAPSSMVKVAGVASREAGKAEAFANEYSLPKHYGSYDAMLGDPSIDAVYNPLPNSLHAEWSIHAVQAGKHVLCEKPLAMSGQEARAMFDAAKRRGVHLVEAYPYLAQAQTQKARELVTSGAVGRLQLIRASFGVQFTDVTNIRLKPDLGGGSLMDAGSYPVSLVRALAGERPTRVHAVARWTETGVDKTLAATLEYESGLIAQITSSFATGYHRHAQVAGDAGTMEFTYLNHPPIGGAPCVHLRRGIMVTQDVETIEVAGGNGFQLEAESFARLVKGGMAQWTGATPQESIDIALTLEALLKSARDKASVAVG
jgi:predicted dehydrogenase